MNQPNPNPFDDKASAWDENPVRRATTVAIARRLREIVLVTPGFRMLEYGCGTGVLGLSFADGAERIDAVDSSSGMLAELRRKLAAAGIRNVRPFELDFTRDAPPAERYHLVASAMTLHHVPDADGLLKTLADLLLPGGTLAIADLAQEDGSFHGGAAVPHRGFDPEALAARFRALGLRDVAWEAVHRVARGGREYPVFLLVGHADCASGRFPLS